MLLDKSIFVYRGKSKFIYVEECVVFQEITSKFIIRWCYILLVSMHKCTFFVYKWLFLTIRSTLWIKHGSRGWECKTLVFFHYPYWALVSHGPEIFVVIPPTCFFLQFWWNWKKMLSLYILSQNLLQMMTYKCIPIFIHDT